MYNKWTDSPLALLLRDLFDLLALNLMCIICCIPVITAGAAISSVYSVIIRQKRDSTIPTFSTYFKCFKENFLPATAIELIVIVFGVICWGDAKYALSIEGGARKLFLVVATIIGVLGLILLTFGWTQIANFKNTVKNYVKNSFVLAVISPFWMLLIWLIWGVVIAAPVFFFNFMATYFGVLYILFGISGPAYITTFILEKIFERFE